MAASTGRAFFRSKRIIVRALHSWVQRHSALALVVDEPASRPRRPGSPASRSRTRGRCRGPSRSARSRGCSPSSVSTYSRSAARQKPSNPPPLRLARDVLEAPPVDLAAGPRPRALPAAARLVRRIARVDLPREALVEVHVQVFLDPRVERVPAHEPEGVVVRAVPVRYTNSQNSSTSFWLSRMKTVVTPTVRLGVRRESSRRASRRREGAVVEPRHGAHAVVEVPEPVDRDGDAEREVGRVAADLLGAARDLLRGEAVGRDRGREERRSARSRRG